MLTRTTAADIQAYIKRAEEGDLGDDEMPPNSVLQGMSRILDSACEGCYSRFEPTLRQSLDIQRAVSTLTHGPRTCGGFKREKGILGSLTPYEQMSALATWMEESGPNIRKPHTFTFLAHDAYEGETVVPIWVKKPKKSPSTLFTTIIGTTTGRLKAPSYQTWAENDPRGTPLGHFVDPLLALEMQRQPPFLASSLLKANPYDAGLLNSDWRYKTKNADGTLAEEGSVEHKKQHTNREVEEIKRRSAGYNLCRMLTKESSRSRNLLPQLRYEDYFEEGYNDDATPSVSPLKICSSISRAISREPEDIEALVEKLFATRLSSTSRIPVVQEYARSALFGVHY